MRALIAALAALLAWSVAADAEAQHRRSRRPRANLAAYRRNVTRWHDPGRASEPRYTDDGRLILRLVSLNGLGAAELTPATADGGFDEAACADAARVMGDARNHRETPMDRRLIEVVYAIARHFRAGQVTVVSGYRAEARHSNHALGRAADILIPGVRDEAVAAYARTLGFTGVGVYPVSGFTHVDVRTRSFFWVDRSRPGTTARRSRRSRRRRGRGGITEIHGELARRSDAEARARGVQPLGGTTGGTVTDGAQADGDDGDGDEDG